MHGCASKTVWFRDNACDTRALLLWDATLTLALTITFTLKLKALVACICVENWSRTLTLTANCSKWVCLVLWKRSSHTKDVAHRSVGKERKRKREKLKMKENRISLSILGRIEWMRCDYCDRWYCGVVCLSVSLSATGLRHAKTAKWIEVLFRVNTLRGLRNFPRQGKESRRFDSTIVKLLWFLVQYMTPTILVVVIHVQYRRGSAWLRLTRTVLTISSVSTSDWCCWLLSRSLSMSRSPSSTPASSLSKLDNSVTWQKIKLVHTVNMTTLTGLPSVT